jgi:hypothetical protein
MDTEQCTNEDWLLASLRPKAGTSQSGATAADPQTSGAEEGQGGKAIRCCMLSISDFGRWAFWASIRPGP